MLSETANDILRTITRVEKHNLAGKTHADSKNVALNTPRVYKKRFLGAIEFTLDQGPVLFLPREEFFLRVRVDIILGKG